jgi:hypothetical protein
MTLRDQCDRLDVPRISDIIIRCSEDLQPDSFAVQDCALALPYDHSRADKTHARRSSHILPVEVEQLPFWY